MDGSKIIKHIHYHIVKKYNEGHVWCIDEIISLTLATIFPYPHKSIDHKNTPCGNIEDVCNVLNGYLGRSKKLRQEIETYSYESLKQYFNDKLVTNLSWNTKIHVVNQLNIASSIENNGFISIRYPQTGCDAVLKIYKDFEVLESSGYGNVEYMPVLQVDKLGENDSVSVEDAPVNKISTPDNVILQQVVTTSLSESLNAKKIESTNTPNTLKTLEKTPSIEKGNNKIDLSPAVVLNPEEEKLNLLWEKIGYDEAKMPYVWKLQIPYRLYCDLKEALQSTFKVVKQSTLLNNHCEKIFVYVAEWFKWEYQPGCQSNAFSDLGVKNISGKVWESLNKWQNFRYSGETNDIHLYSIYALGGFPLLAILKSDRIDNLFECLLHEDDIDVLTESLLKVIPGLSDAFRQSLADGELGSWSKYIQALCDRPELLYADCDKDANEYVMHFYERLENGRRESIGKVIKPQWIFYTSSDSDNITGDIVVKIGKDRGNGCIAAEIVKSEKDQLYIGIECQNEIINFRKYSKTSDCKRFVGWGTISNRIRGYIEDLSQTISLCKYDTNLLQPSKGEIITTFDLGHKYIEVYATDDGSGWTTLREFKKNTKAVLFPSEAYDIVGNTSNLQNKIIGNVSWSICEILEVVQLIDKETGKVYNLYQEGEVSVRLVPRTEIIKYHDPSKALIKCFIDGKDEYLPLMMGIPTGKAIKIYPNKSREDNFALKFKDSNVIAEYTQNRRRCTLTENDTFGVISLDLCVKSNGVVYNYKNKYFFIPANCIRRDVTNNKIIFDGLAGRKVCKVQYDDEEIFLETNYYEDNGSTYQIDDTIKFRIYDTETDYIEVDIYRPILYRELSLNGNVIKRYNDIINNEQKISLPYILREDFNLRIFDKDGVNYPSHFRNMRWFPLGRPQNAIQQCDEFSIYLYANRQIKNEETGVLDIGSKGVEQYRFYYWKVDNETQPCFIETSYDKEKQRLIIPTECLTNGGLIFQSLNNCTPRHYVTPIYADNNWILLTNPPYSDPLIYKCYKIAVAHKVPFTQFYPLHRAVTSLTTLRALYDNVMADKNFSKTEGFAELHRFANEFCFEWILLPQGFWRKADKQQVVKLLQHSSFIQNSTDKQLLRRFVEIYLNTKLQDGVQVRKQNIARTFRYMRGMKDVKKDPQMIPASIENVEAIKCLYESNEWINDLLVVLENN